MEEWPSMPMPFDLSLPVQQKPIHPSSFDPYQTMLKRKRIDTDQIQQYDENDVYELEQFCKEHNILGFNCGRMNPKSALNILRSKLGVKTESITNKKMLFG